MSPIVPNHVYPRVLAGNSEQETTGKSFKIRAAEIPNPDREALGR